MQQQPILFLTPCFECAGYGGVQAAARVASEALLSSSHFLYSRLCYGPTCQQPAKQVENPCVRTQFASVVSSLRLPRQERTVLVWHVQLLKLLPFLRGPKRRVFVFLHGIECWRPLGALLNFCLSKQRVTFLTNSHFTWSNFIKHNPRWQNAEHRVVWLGLGDAGQPPEETEPLADAAVIVGRLARAESYKGHAEVISAWKDVLKSRPDAQFWIIGDGDQRAELEQLAKSEGVEKSVIFHGSVSNAEKGKLLSRAKCLVMPSRGEGFGLVYLEAMRRGRPCIVSDADAGREIVSPPEAGLSVNPSSSGELAAAVCRLLESSPEWDRLSLSAARRYETNFTETHFSQRLLSAITEPV